MDVFYERLIVRAATVDELLSGDFEPLPGTKDDADFAARRLAAWRRAAASGDASLFARRLDRDRLSLAQVTERLTRVRRKPSAPPPPWIDDAIWIEAALQSPAKNTKPRIGIEQSDPRAFEHLFTPLVEQAETLLWQNLDARVRGKLNENAQAGLRHALLRELSNFCMPALYERFDKARNAASPPNEAPGQDTGTARYDRFVADMKAGGFRRLFEDKPVLLRLIASIARQWIDAGREFVLRLDADLAAIRRDILHTDSDSKVARIEGDLSDRHNNGRAVLIVSSEDGARVVYKPKDLRLDVAWHALVERLNHASPPVALKAVYAVARDGYGWTEYIAHEACAGRAGFEMFFRRAGAWLALFHCFAATDMHQENMIAAGDHPVPIDLETIFHATAAEQKDRDAEDQAFDAAMETVANSVMMVGLLPAYGRAADNTVFAIGGMNAEWNAKTLLRWNAINSDAMRPTRSREAGASLPNLPHLEGRYAKFGDHIGDFVSGFQDYAKFLLRRSKAEKPGELFDGFAGLPVRRVMRPTRFYYMLLQRLKDHRTMDDGALWSAQADFIARLADWEKDRDPDWPLQHAERAALLALNVPHFVTPSDGNEIRDAAGFSLHSEAKPGMDRARAHMQDFDERDIVWQVDVIKENANSVLQSGETAAIDLEAGSSAFSEASLAPAKQIFIAEADRIAAELGRYAIRRGPGAAWIGLDWLGDSEVFQLVCLGPDLYNGVSGIALFLAAHAAVTGNKDSRELALAGVVHLRHGLKSRNAARMARSLGLGGATGLGSIVYALAVMAKCLRDDALLADAHTAASLMTDALIAADKQLDVIGGSAGAILGLLRLYRDTGSADALARAAKCGEHLLSQNRLGPEGRRNWVGQGFRQQGLNGMSHGAAGFAYALGSLSAATGRDEFADAARECIASENSSFDPERHNWPDLRSDGEPRWPCRWCHGAPGIGLARIATAKNGGLDAKILTTDIRNAVAGVERERPSQLDTLCCGTLGGIEFLCEAGDALERLDLREQAARRLMAVLERAAATGDYRWNSGKRQFNLGLFRGLAGVGYTVLRQADASLPNVLIWE